MDIMATIDVKLSPFDDFETLKASIENDVNLWDVERFDSTQLAVDEPEMEDGAISCSNLLFQSSDEILTFVVTWSIEPRESDWSQDELLALVRRGYEESTYGFLANSDSIQGRVREVRSVVVVAPGRTIG